jgi:hypothetical protein
VVLVENEFPQVNGSCALTVPVKNITVNNIRIPDDLKRG